MRTDEEIDRDVKDLERAERRAKKTLKAMGYHHLKDIQCCATCDHSYLNIEDSRRCDRVTDDRWQVDAVDDLAICGRWTPKTKR